MIKFGSFGGGGGLFQNRKPTQAVVESRNLPGSVLVDEDGLGGDIPVQHAGAGVEEGQALRYLQKR